MRLIDTDKLEAVVTKVNDKGFGITRSEYKRIELVISEFPTVDAEPIRHGKWEYDVETAAFKCSECGKRIWSMTNEIAGINYCPNCGARMSESDTAPSEEEYDDFYAKHRD